MRRAKGSKLNPDRIIDYDALSEPGSAQEQDGATAELHSLQKVLQQSRNKLKAIFDTMDAPVFSLTAQGVVESVNFAAARLAGKHPRELVGLRHDAFLGLISGSLPIGEACQKDFARMRDRAKPLRRLYQADSAGGPLFYDVSHTPVFGDDGGLCLVIVQVNDITELKRMELAVRQHSQCLEQNVAERTAELTKANQELKRLDQLRQDLTNMVVHDMKGPLGGLMGNLELIAFGPLDVDQREALDMAYSDGENLLRMIMNLLDICRLEEDRLVLNLRETAVGALAERLKSSFAALAALKGVSIETEDPGGVRVMADGDLLYRVVQNLFTNALNHTEKGVIILRAAKEKDSGDQPGVLISVSDTGSGIPREMHGRIFQKFIQADKVKGPRNSTGLGLTFCKLAVEAHGGRIWFKSQEGQGTTFFLWLPDATDSK
ncbi:hypothetical protein AAU61_10515 [Desulfocarbo indianensis]|nr:hypothetical protein AAU61_10515 [Desulfocarbo indianensis]